MNKLFKYSLILLLPMRLMSQSQEEEMISSIYRNALTDSFAYQTLRYLCINTEGRIAGSKAAEIAVNYSFEQLKSLDPDTVYLQPVLVPCWERGETEKSRIHSDILGNRELNITAIGMSAGTGAGGISARVVEVKTFQELDSLGTEKVKGKIVFFNRPMDPGLINTFVAYGLAGDQRVRGASVASKYGASAVIVRSLASSIDKYPHTGVLWYDEQYPKIPAVAVSTADAELLSDWLKKDKNLLLEIETHCLTHPDVVSYNVIAELRGQKKPEEIMTIGGHLDAWDTGQGAHDDGAGCVQSMEVLRIFKELNIRPNRTIRVVMFMDEEIAQRGGQEYALQARLSDEKHVFALESDRGALTPLGFGFSGPDDRIQQLKNLSVYFRNYNLYIFKTGGSAVDIGPLQQDNKDIVLSSYIPDWQRYFEYHHSPNDSFKNINYRELQAGSAAIVSLVFLVDKFML